MKKLLFLLLLFPVMSFANVEEFAIQTKSVKVNDEFVKVKEKCDGSIFIYDREIKWMDVTSNIHKTLITDYVSPISEEGGNSYFYLKAHDLNNHEYLLIVFLSPSSLQWAVSIETYNGITYIYTVTRR